MIQIIIFFITTLIGYMLWGFLGAVLGSIPGLISFLAGLSRDMKYHGNSIAVSCCDIQ
jgi:hypothetical protein